MTALNSVCVDRPCVNRYSLTGDAGRNNSQEKRIHMSTYYKEYTDGSGYALMKQHRVIPNMHCVFDSNS